VNLYLLRHGIAAERGPRWAGRDADRPLTTKGARKVRRIAEAMKEMDLSFDLILSSPFRRAKETAEIVADLFDCGDRLKFSAHLKVGGRPSSLIHEITTRYPSCRSALLVGHEPYLSSLISVLVSGENNLLITMKKGGLCKLEAQHLRYGRCASLEWLLGPSQLLHAE
jgi:phosphohistidine phosphatase